LKAINKNIYDNFYNSFDNEIRTAISVWLDENNLKVKKEDIATIASIIAVIGTRYKKLKPKNTVDK